MKAKFPCLLLHGEATATAAQIVSAFFKPFLHLCVQNQLFYICVYRTSFSTSVCTEPAFLHLCVQNQLFYICVYRTSFSTSVCTEPAFLHLCVQNQLFYICVYRTSTTTVSVNAIHCKPHPSSNWNFTSRHAHPRQVHPATPSHAFSKMSGKHNHSTFSVPTPVHLSHTASVAEWLRRPPRERKIQGSNPACAGIFLGRVIPVT